MRRFLHGRSYDQMIADGDLPNDRGERLMVMLSESWIRGMEQGIIAGLMLFAIGGALVWFLWP